MRTGKYEARKIYSSVPYFVGSETSTVLATPNIEVVLDGKIHAVSSEIRMNLFPHPSIKIHFELDLHTTSRHWIDVMDSADDIVSVKINGANVGGFFVELIHNSGDGRRLSCVWAPESEPLDDIGNESTQMAKTEAILFDLALQGMPLVDRTGENKVNVVETIDLRSSLWNMRLNGIEKSETVAASLKKKGRHGPTHVAELWKPDRGQFSAEEAMDGMNALRLFLCFVEGRETRCVCPAGFGSNGDRVWSRWSSPRAWGGNVLSWFPANGPHALTALFPGFIDRWQSENWRAALKDIISWYVVGNQLLLGLDPGIILAQTAIERLSYEYCVLEKLIVSKQGFKALPAADQFRMLLSSLSIPLDIPASATTLASEARAFNWEDGPQAVTHLRNAIVHGGQTKGKWPLDCYIEASKLSLWYLEMVLLAICNYEGTHINRNSNMFEDVPWLT